MLAQALPLPLNNEPDLEACILRYLPQVRAIAQQLRRRLPHHADLDELIGAGVLGLIDAVLRFDPAREAALSTYAAFRIRGAILDSLRAQDWAPRQLRHLARRIETEREALHLVLGREATEPELSAHLGIPLAELRERLLELHTLRIESLLDESEAVERLASPLPSPFTATLRAEREVRLTVAVARLPERARQVITLYYQEERTMREIGAQLGVSESRVCQIHAEALRELRRLFRD